MKTHSRVRSLIATLVVLSLAGSGNVWAGRSDDHESRGNGHGGYQNKHSSYNKHKGNRHNYGGGHSGYRGGGHGGNYYQYRYKDDHGTEKLIGGLLIGGLVGYALGNSKQQDYHGYNSYPQSAPQRQARPAVHTAHRDSAATCLQEREYQTTVIVGGREVDAYGTACLQPDGSWTRSAARTTSF